MAKLFSEIILPGLLLGMLACVASGAQSAIPTQPIPNQQTAEQRAQEYLRSFVLLNAEGRQERSRIGQQSPFVYLLAFSREGVYSCNGFQIHRERANGWLMTAAHCVTRARQLGATVFRIVYFNSQNRQRSSPVVVTEPVYLGVLPGEPGAATAPFLLDVAILRIPDGASRELDVLDIRPERNAMGNSYVLSGYEHRAANSGEGAFRDRERAQFRQLSFPVLPNLPRIHFRVWDRTNRREWPRSLQLGPGRSIEHDERFGLFLEGPHRSLGATLSGSLLVRGNEPVGLFHTGFRVRSIAERWSDAPGIRGLSSFVVAGIRDEARRRDLAFDASAIDFDRFRYRPADTTQPAHEFALSERDETVLYGVGLSFRPFIRAVTLPFDEGR